MSSAKKQSPGEFIRNSKGKAVIVKLNNAIDYRGSLVSLDGWDF